MGFVEAEWILAEADAAGKYDFHRNEEDSLSSFALVAEEGVALRNGSNSGPASWSIDFRPSHVEAQGMVLEAEEEACCVWFEWEEA